MSRITLLAVFLVALPALGQDLPVVTGVEGQPLMAQVTRLKEALDFLGSSLQEEDAARLEALRDRAPDESVVREIQATLDPYCLAMVEINPEARVSAETDYPCIFDNRVGMARSYAKLEGALDFDRDMEELKNGRSYVSDGKSHIIDFHVDEQELGVEGSELRLERPKTVTVTARVAAYLPEEQDELGAFLQAEWCRKSVDQCGDMKLPEIREEEREAARAAYDHARETYDRIIEEARERSAASER